MTSVLQLNYDELTQIASVFRDEGEEIISQYFLILHKLYSLRQDWVGKAADSFFQEMDEIVLPAHKRAGESLFLADEATRKLMRIISSADEEVGKMFMTDDFGTYSRQAGFPQTNTKIDEQDFGKSLFEKSLSGLGDNDSSNSNTIFELPDQNKPAQQESHISDTNPKSDVQEAAFPQSETSSGVGNNSETLGAKGNLNELGNSLDTNTPSTDSSVETANSSAPDYLYATSGIDEEKTLSVVSGEGGQTSASKSSLGNAASGVAGASAASAAIGTAGKVIKEAAKKSSK